MKRFHLNRSTIRNTFIELYCSMDGKPVIAFSMEVSIEPMAFVRGEVRLGFNGAV